MANSEDFNPFSILPKSLMLRVLHHTFEKDAIGDFKNFMDYDAVNGNFRKILGHEKNLKYILDSMPTELNIQLITSLKKRKIINPPGRYRAGVALLFLKYLYQHVKPFPDDEFLENQFDYYFDALLHVQKFFHDYPMVVYVNAYVAFYMAKRLLLVSAGNQSMREHGFKLFKVAAECIVRAHELDHPLAQLFHNDMMLQMSRQNLNMKELLKGEIPKEPKISVKDVVNILAKKNKVNLDLIDEENQSMIVVTWQKLILENTERARDLFNFAVDYDLLESLTHYFYECFVVNHFHRHVLAYNPVFVVKNNKNLLKMFKYWKVNALVGMHQGFRVFYPSPNSLLLCTLLKTDEEGLDDLKPLVDHFLTLPQKGTRGWRVCFIDAYRDAVDDGSLKNVSEGQMRVVLKYFELVNQAGMIHSIMEREAYILGSVFHCNNDMVHEIAIAVIMQLTRYSSFDPLGHLDHQEILLSTLYQDRETLNQVQIRTAQDFERVATSIIQSYKKHISDSMQNQAEIIVPEFLRGNKEKLSIVRKDFHQKFVDLGLMKAA